MTPPAHDLDDVIEKHREMLRNIIEATKETKPKRLVYLSSIGGHLETGTGAIRKLYDMEHLPPITYSVSDSEIHAWYIVWFADSKPAGHPTKE